MKQFDKWWKENTDQWGYIHQVGQTYIAKDVWKAALEWMKTRTKGGFDFDSGDIVNIVDEEIGKGETENEIIEIIK